MNASTVSSSLYSHPLSKPSNLTKRMTIELNQLYYEISKTMVQKRQKKQRPFQERPLHQATLGFSETVALVLKKEYAQTEEKNPTIAHPSAMQNDGYDDANDDYIFRENEIWRDRFQILRPIGKGSFGLVVEALDRVKQEKVAIKIIKNRTSFTNQAQIEMKIVRFLNGKDEQDTHNIVRIKGHFFFRNHLCIVYEMLSLNLYDVLRKVSFQGLPLSLVRKFANQILVSLAFLSRKDIQVIHCDLKPENVLLRDVKKSLIKVIDFGSSCFSNERAYSYIQSRFYRSPEVIMGLPYTTAIDIWSFGCLLVELLVGEPLFAGTSEQDQMFKICATLGLPPAEMIEQSPSDKINRLFVKIRRGQYRLAIKGSKAPLTKNLVSIIKTKMNGSEESGLSASDYFNFLDLIERMLMFHPEERITPQEALMHPFLKPMINQQTNTELTLNL